MSGHWAGPREPMGRGEAEVDRPRLLEAWNKYYERFSGEEKTRRLGENARLLEGRMRKLAALPQSTYKGYRKRKLEIALGMSLGVHRQLLAGLTFVSSGGRIKGGGGA